LSAARAEEDCTCQLKGNHRTNRVIANGTFQVPISRRGKKNTPTTAAEAAARQLNQNSNRYVMMLTDPALQCNNSISQSKQTARRITCTALAKLMQGQHQIQQVSKNSHAQQPSTTLHR